LNKININLNNKYIRSKVHAFSSNLNRRAKNNMNIMDVDFVMVYLKKEKQYLKQFHSINNKMYGIVNTYNETVTNSKPQLEKAMSIPLTKPMGTTFRMRLGQFTLTLCLPFQHCHKLRHMAATRNLINRWHITTRGGCLKIYNRQT
jgi:hypothetical protein